MKIKFFSIFLFLFIKIKLRNGIVVILYRYLLDFVYDTTFEKALSIS